MKSCACPLPMTRVFCLNRVKLIVSVFELASGRAYCSGLRRVLRLKVLVKFDSWGKFRYQL